MKQVAFFLLLFLITFLSKAQGDWVVTLQNDTIKGKIGFITNGPYDMDQISIKVGKKKTKYTPLEVKRLSKKNDQFIPYKVNGKYQFVKVVVEGYLSWLKYLNPDSNGYEDFSMNLLAKKDGTNTLVSNIGFMKAVRKFLEDCEPLEEKIKNNEYKPRDLEEIVSYYNNWMDMKSSVVEKRVNTGDLEKANAVSTFIDEVSEDKELSTNQELMEMLKDVQGKMKEGKAVPGYLKNGILESLKENAELTEKFNALF
ncbi:MAG: hypothetical protein JXR07_15285 [Reichenbachiella sp.]